MNIKLKITLIKVWVSASIQPINFLVQVYFINFAQNSTIFLCQIMTMIALINKIN